METPLIPAGGPVGMAAGELPVQESPLPIEEVARYDVPTAARYSVANFGSSVVYGLFNSGMPLYLETYGIFPWLIGLLANERAFVGAIVQPFVGRLSDRTRSPLGRRRPFFLVGVPLMSISLLLLAVHPNIWVMLGLMTIGSFFLAVAQDPYIALLADLFPEQHRGKVGGFLGLTTALGIITFSLIAHFLWDSNEALVFGLVIAILLVTYAFTFFTVKEPPAPAIATEEKKRPFNLKLYIKELRQYPEAAKYIGALCLFWIGTGGATPYVTLFGTKALNASTSDVFLLPLAFVVMSAIFSVPAGRLSDRIGKKRVMFGGLLIYGIGALIGSQAHDLMQATLALAVIGIGNAGTAALNPLLTDLIPRSRTAELMGLGSAVWSFAQPLGSALAGIIVTVAALFVGEHDAYRWTFIFAGAMIVLAGLSLRFVHPERVTSIDR
ncbi:MAG: MFS transporter [Chloroflexota bacterium]